MKYAIKYVMICMLVVSVGLVSASYATALTETISETNSETTESVSIGVRVIGEAPADVAEFMKNNNKLGPLWEQDETKYYGDCSEVVDINGNGKIEVFPWFSECRIREK